jgi:hypothetical protein
MLLFRHMTKVLAKKTTSNENALFTPRGLHTHQGLPKIRK